MKELIKKCILSVKFLFKSFGLSIEVDIGGLVSLMKRLKFINTIGDKSLYLVINLEKDGWFLIYFREGRREGPWDPLFPSEGGLTTIRKGANCPKFLKFLHFITIRQKFRDDKVSFEISSLENKNNINSRPTNFDNW